MTTLTNTQAIALYDGTFAICADQKAFDAAMALAQGDYQERVLNGLESLSGSTLTGNAKKYGGKYAASRKALLARLTAAGIAWGEAIGAKSKRILVIGARVVADDAQASV